jgi:alanine-glyoxylate transaminase/serine-glyoxylate transaminase/serine-pyruvate transaminase
MLFGSGTLVMEMGIENTLAPGDEAINIITGFFGSRWEEIMRHGGIHAYSIRSDVGQTVPPEAVEKAFKEHKNAKALVAVHVDTSSGVTSPIIEYAEIARRYGATIIVDAISSFGGMPLEIEKWGIDFCAGYPNKCMSSISGITPYAVSKRMWENLELKNPQTAWYINLKVIRGYIEDWGSWGHPYPTTIPIQPVVALREAVRVIQRQGLQNYYSTQRRAGKAIREAARALGLKLVAGDDVAAPVITPISIGDGLEKTVQSILLDQYNIQVAGGLIGPMIRIGTMGRSANPQYILATVSALESALRQVGLPVQRGAALKAAQEQLSKHD